MKKTWVRFLAYLAFMSVMLLVFVNLDALVGRFVRTGVNDLRKVDFKTYEAMAKDVVHAGNAILEFGSDDWQTLSITGDCCVDTAQDNLEKTVTVLFKSEDVCYASKRRSILGNAPEGAVRPRGNSHGYGRNISLLPMKNGVYELWLFDWENEENYGLTPLDVQIVKDKYGTRMVERTVSLGLKEELYNEAKWCLDYVREAGSGGLSFGGWAFQEDTQTLGQTVYLKLSAPQETRYIECTLSGGRTVALFFGNDKYDYCRFQGHADRSWIGDGPLEISVVLKNENGFHAGNTVYLWDPAAEKTLQSTPVKDPLHQTCPFDKNVVQPAFGFLDVAKKENELVSFTGWVAAEGQETQGQKVYLELQTENGPRYAKCTQVLRTGVGDVLENRLYDHSGYTCSIAAEDLPAAEFDFQIFMENEAGVYTDGVVHRFDPVTGQFK